MGISRRWCHLQGFGVDRWKAGQVGEDLERRVSGLIGLGLDLGGLLLQVLGQFLGLRVPARREGGVILEQQWIHLLPDLCQLFSCLYCYTQL